MGVRVEGGGAMEREIDTQPADDDMERERGLCCCHARGFFEVSDI